ncbi:MAG: S9 family peptidase [Saprospiraceae bacterium]|nr:S9 family peptidase [Saprospiraceae bacterium]
MARIPIFIAFCVLLACNNPKNMTEMNNGPISEMMAKADSIAAPVATPKPYTLEKHGDKRNDPYYWMKLTDDQKNAATPDDQTKDVVAYLEAENKYREQVMSHTTGFQEKLYNEIVGRIKQTDMSVPYKYHGYFYINRFEEGKDYAIHARKKGNLDAAEEIMVDENERAANQKYYAATGFDVSPDNRILAFGEDLVSRRQYTIRFKNLTTGSFLPDEIPNTNGGVVWASDNKTVFYEVKDEALRSYKIMKHTLGAPIGKDKVVFHETDETFSTYIFKTKSEKYIVICSYATLAQEYRYIDAGKPDVGFTVFQPRQKKLEHSIEHFEDKWYIRTNKDDAKNFKIMTCPLGKTSLDNWTDFVAHRDDVLVEGMTIFKKYFVLSERVRGITKLRIMPWQGKDHYIDFKQEAYTAQVGINPDFDTDLLRVGFTSMTTPNTTYDYQMETKTLTTLKQQEVVGKFNADDYTSERFFVKATDGREIPVSLVYKKGFNKDGKAPLLLYAYGSYGSSMDPYFSSVRLSLLDRGFAFAMAHIRGGEEMGRYWYEEGKFFNKKNTFTDYITCAEYLVAQKYTAANKLFAQGGSAGGLLMGAVANMRPDLFKGIIAQVPFVDVVTTMLDESIPLTTGEYDEWGNPNDKAYYDYMKSYSPYDNVTAQSYPSMLVTTGYWDSQVQYWEPAKWVAKLRTLKTDKNPLLMYCNMDTGHGGASGRFKRFRETAMEYAFIFDLVGIKE